MSAFNEAERVLAELERRVEQVESQLRTLRGADLPPRTHFKVSEVAKMIGRKPSTVRTMIADGRLQAEDMGGWYAVPAAAVSALAGRRSA